MSATAWTCQLVPRGGRLLDVTAIAATVRDVGQQFSVRGVEATVIGELVRGPPAGEGGADAPLLVRLRGTGEVLQLAPLRRKVQWDADAGRPAPISAAERAAYARLAAEWRGPARPGRSPSRSIVRLVGPVVAPERGGPGGAPNALPNVLPNVLEVRQYRWLP